MKKIITILLTLIISTNAFSDVRYRGNDAVGFYISPATILNATETDSGGQFVGYYCMVADDNGNATDYSINFNNISNITLRNGQNDRFAFDLYLINYNTFRYAQVQNTNRINMGEGSTENVCAGGRINFIIYIVIYKENPSGTYAAGNYCSNNSARIRSYFQNNRPRDTHRFDICLDWSGDPDLNEIQVKNLDDIVLGTYIGNTIAPSEEEFCVYLNNSNSYNISFSDTNSNGSFDLVNGVNTIPYAMNFKNKQGDTIPVTENSPISSTWFTQDNNCSNVAENVLIEVIPDNVSISNSSAGTYTSTLNITVSPE